MNMLTCLSLIQQGRCKALKVDVINGNCIGGGMFHTCSRTILRELRWPRAVALPAAVVEWVVGVIERVIYGRDLNVVYLNHVAAWMLVLPGGVCCARPGLLLLELMGLHGLLALSELLHRAALLLHRLMGRLLLTALLCRLLGPSKHWRSVQACRSRVLLD